MRFTVIVPVYNVEKYLARCLDSVVNQTFRDYEIIVIDDGTPDRSGEIADEYHAKYPDMIRVIHQKNQGLGGARNSGIKAARGDYLLFLDSDDVIDSQCLFLLNDNITKNNSDIVVFDMRIFDDCGLSNRVILGDGGLLDNNNSNIDLKQLLRMTPSACNKTFRRKLFIENDIFFPERLWYEDLATTGRVAYYALTISYINKSLYYYYENNESIIHNINQEKAQDIMVAYDVLYKFYLKNKLEDQYKKELEYVAIEHILINGANRVLKYKPNFNIVDMFNKNVSNRFPKYYENEYVYDPKMKEKVSLLFAKKYKKFYFQYCIKNIIRNEIMLVIKKILGVNIVSKYRRIRYR